MTLTRSQILSRLRKKQGNPLEEASSILGEMFKDSGPTVVEREQPTAMNKYKVNFSPRRMTKRQPPRSA